MATSATANRGLVALIKRGWNEIPEIMGSGVHALIGLGVMVYACKVYYENDGNNRRYRSTYVVLRHDDPKVPTLKTHCDITSRP
ncbi:uncharacterized protein NdufA3 [Euwallacea similis]|uniref:uncharacterized protein NdufA3 n=1 Tax=Euwallacea similis TaxID=1736056 RepID=UPI0034509CDB